MNTRFTITAECFNALPANCTILCNETIKHPFQNKQVEAIKVTWIDKDWADRRTAHFAVEDGEYLGDSI